MNKFDSIRQQSLNAWAPAQKKWQQDQQKHPNFVVEAQNQNDSKNDAAGAAGVGSGGSLFTNLPLNSLQITSVAYTKVVDGNYFYTVANHTAGTITTETDSGLSSDTWVLESTNSDQAGNSLYYFSAGNDKRIQYVGSSGNVITEYTWSVSDSYNVQEIINYYNGGIGLLLYNDSTDNAKFMYWYNGQLYQKIWTGTWFGLLDSYNYSFSKKGAVPLLTRNNGSNQNADLWIFGPGTGGTGNTLKATYTANRYDINQVSPWESYYSVNSDGTPSNNSSWETIYLNIAVDGDDFLTSVDVISSDFVNSWSCLQDIKDALSAYDTGASLSTLTIEEYYRTRAGNDLGLLLYDDTNWYICVINPAQQQVRLVYNYDDIAVHNENASMTQGSLDNITYISCTQSTYFDYDFLHSNDDFLVSVLYKDNQFEQYTIPSTYIGDPVYVYFDRAIANNTTSVTLLASVDQTFYKVTLSKGQAEPVFTVIPNSTSGIDECYVDRCYNDIKNEWFIKITKYNSPNIQYILINEKTGAVLDNTTINRDNFSAVDHGVIFVPAMLRLQNGGIFNIWCLDYNTYKWNLAIDTTATPTADAYLSTYYEGYDKGYENMPGGSRWVFVDPDLTRCWYITTKYGVQQSETVPWAVISDGSNNNIGEVYSYGIYDTGDGPGSCVAQVSTGQFAAVDYNRDCTYWEFSNDRWVNITQTPGDDVHYWLDIFIGTQKTSIKCVEVWWRYNDLVEYD